MSKYPLAAKAISDPATISVLVVEPSRTGCELLVSSLASTGFFHRVRGFQTIPAARRAVLSEPIDVALIASEQHEGTERTLELIRYLSTLATPVRSLVIAHEWKPAAVIKAFTHGAKGVFTWRDHELSLLCKALICIHMGQVWANSQQLNHTLEYFARNAGHDGASLADAHPSLSGRERQIAELLAGGATNKEIAKALHISERTVKNHLGSIFEKIGVNSRVRAALRLVRRD